MANEAVSAFIRSATWLIEPDRLKAYLEALAQPHPAPVQAAHQQRRRATTGPIDSIAVIPVHGPITYRAGPFSYLFGGATITELSRALGEALSSPEVSSIVLDIDSPGGTVDGVEEFGDELRQARSQKPIIAAINTLGASAAFWIAAQADEIVITPSAEAGSVGVWVLHVDLSQQLAKAGITPTFVFAGDRKVDANPLEPLGKTARADLQAKVDSIYAAFLAAVARGRGTTASAVRGAYGDGRLYNARDSVRLGLADRIGTFADVLARGPSSASRGQRRAEIQAQADRDLLDVTLAEMAATSPEDRAARAQAQADRELLDDALAKAEHAILLDEIDALTG